MLKAQITILGNTRVGFEEWVILEGDAGTIEIKSGIHYTPKGGESEPLAYPRPEGYPHSKVDQLVGLVKGEYDANYTIRYQWRTHELVDKFNP